MLGREGILTIATTLVTTSAPALAVEGTLGRTLPGVWIQPQGAVVGPGPGFTYSTIPIGYMGAIGGSRLVPIGGSIFSNVDAEVSTNWLVPEYVYKTETRKVTLSSSFLGVINWVGSTGSLQFNDVSRGVSKSDAGIGDVAFSPLTAGIHFSDNNNLAISTMIFAPTGLFRPGNIPNLGMGEWTFMPNMAHPYLWEKRGLELDSFVGFDIYTQNTTTRYSSGTMFHWDGMVIQYLSKRVGFGAIGSNLTQITDDTGPVARVLHGFEGRAWGVGPIAFYVAKVEKPGVICSTSLGQRVRGDEFVEREPRSLGAARGAYVFVRHYSEAPLSIAWTYKHLFQANARLQKELARDTWPAAEILLPNSASQLTRRPPAPG